MTKSDQPKRSVLDRATQYAKDVVTLKAAKEGFFKDDGTIDQWFAHGASEAANMVLHGHPAPIYAGSTSPAELQQAEATDLVVSPLIDKLTKGAEANQDIEIEVEPPSNDSILGSLTMQAEQLQEPNAPEIEMDP